MSADGEFRPLRVEEAAATAERFAASFGAVGLPDDPDKIWRQRITEGEVWGWAPAPGADAIAHCRLTTVDHWFNGRRVTCQHVAAVAVPPEHRGRGAGRQLMLGALEEGVRSGATMSLLFPATTRMYRGLGYEHAGHFSRYRVNARALPTSATRLRRAAPEDWPAIQACHRRYTETLNGPQVDHGPRTWETLQGTRFAYVLDGPSGGLEAYALVDHEALGGDWRHRLVIADWAATTARGLQAVVGFVASHGTTAKDATFQGGVPDPWSLLAAEQNIVEDDGFFWMARPLDLPGALAARGYAPGSTGMVTIAVDDPLGSVTVTLRLEDGVASATPAPGAQAALQLDVRAIGPLLTGFRSAEELVLAGLIDGDPPAVRFLSTAFAAPPPLLLDFF